MQQQGQLYSGSSSFSELDFTTLVALQCQFEIVYAFKTIVWSSEHCGKLKTIKILLSLIRKHVQ